MPAPRFVVYGAGAIGGTVGCRLDQRGHEVVLIARGAHGDAIAAHGLRLETPDGVTMHSLEVHAGPEALGWRPDDIVLLTMKGQDTTAAVERLAAAAPASIAVACVQNGVENERLALRRFARTYSVVVQLPATHLVPGVVVAHSSPVLGSLDVGRHPHGVDATAELLAGAFADAGFAAQARADVARWKYAKLLRNVGNAVGALLEPGEAADRVTRLATEEARAAFAAAGIEIVPDDEYNERHARLITLRAVAGQPHRGNSTWQSLARASGGIEADHLNGEIVLLGRLHNVATPVNERLCELATEAARRRSAPASLRGEDVLAAVAPA